MSDEVTELTRQTAAALAALSPYTRLWFWLNPATTPPLLLKHPLTPGCIGLLRQDAAHLKEQSDSAPLLGMAALGKDGCLQLIGEGLNHSALAALASWTRASAETQPALQVLTDAVLLRTDADGRIQETIRDPALWQGLTRPAAPGSLAHAVEALGRTDESGCWVWMTDQGPDGAPALVAQPCSEDEDAVAFNGAASRMALRCPKTARALSGILYGGRALITAGDLDLAESVRAALAAQDAEGLAPLLSARLLQKRPGAEISDARPPHSTGEAAPATEDEADLSELDGLDALDDLMSLM